MLKHVRNVTGMVPWRRLVACYSCFILYIVYVCLHFAAMCDNLHRTVISPAFCEKSSHFGVILSIHDTKSLLMILSLHYNGFCYSWLKRRDLYKTSAFCGHVFIMKLPLKKITLGHMAENKCGCQVHLSVTSFSTQHVSLFAPNAPTESCKCTTRIPW